MQGITLYDGLSQLDGYPILVIATLNSRNVKTGDMIQTWILNKRDDPLRSIRDGRDTSICGDCKHRGDGFHGRSCYVDVSRAPLTVWRAAQSGRYPSVNTTGFAAFHGRQVRLGSYGDPAAVPLHIWQQVARHAAGLTGYTHQWLQYPALAQYCMASVDTSAERLLATLLGWRTFRVSNDGGKERGESICPASKEAGYKLQCIDCGACNGNTSNRRGDITIKVHGSAGKVSAFQRLNKEC